MARWDRLNNRGNVQDRRGMGRPGMAIGGIGGLGLIVVLLLNLSGGGGAGLDQVLDPATPHNAIPLVDSVSASDHHRPPARSMPGIPRTG